MPTRAARLAPGRTPVRLCRNLFAVAGLRTGAARFRSRRLLRDFAKALFERADREVGLFFVDQQRRREP